MIGVVVVLHLETATLVVETTSGEEVSLPVTLHRGFSDMIVGIIATAAA